MCILLHWLKQFIISVVLIVAVWLVGLLYFVSLIPDTPNVSDKKVHAAIVLTGGSKRVAHGFEQLSGGLADELFISGVNDETTPEHVVKQLKQKISAELSSKVTFGYKARSTIGNAEEVVSWINKQRIGSIRLITANYHMPRSLQEFAFVLPESAVVVPDPVFPDGFDISRWLVDSNSLRLVMSEYHKFLASHLRHLLVVSQSP